MNEIPEMIRQAMARVAAEESAAEKFLRQAATKVARRIALTDLVLGDDGELLYPDEEVDNE